jgi:hypothetical protein
MSDHYNYSADKTENKCITSDIGLPSFVGLRCLYKVLSVHRVCTDCSSREVSDYLIILNCGGRLSLVQSVGASWNF